MNEFTSSPLTSTQEPNEPIDPGFTYPDSGAVIPPADDVIDPDFSVMPPVYPPYNPYPPVYPDYPPYAPTPNIPCIFCNNNQWIRGGIRFLNAATGYNAFTISIDNRTAASGLNFSEITRYRQVTQGYHTFTVSGLNGYVYLRKSLYVGDGMATIAVINSSTGLDLTSIADTACPTNNNSACFRVSNLAYYSRAVNVSIGNVIFNALGFNQTASFSQFGAGNYTVNVARSARPGNTLVTTPVTLRPHRIYTLYVLNWNASADTIRTLLVEDRRN